MPYPWIYVDFNNADPNGHVRLNTLGTFESLAESGIRLTDGLSFVVYDEELEADGELHFSTEERIWVASIDWDAIRSHASPSKARGA